MASTSTAGRNVPEGSKFWCQHATVNLDKGNAEESSRYFWASIWVFVDGNLTKRKKHWKADGSHVHGGATEEISVTETRSLGEALRYSFFGSTLPHSSSMIASLNFYAAMLRRYSIVPSIAVIGIFYCTGGAAGHNLLGPSPHLNNNLFRSCHPLSPGSFKPRRSVALPNTNIIQHNPC
jgi:hypothetical protein